MIDEKDREAAYLLADKLEQYPYWPPDRKGLIAEAARILRLFALDERVLMPEKATQEQKAAMALALLDCDVSGHDEEDMQEIYKAAIDTRPLAEPPK